MKQQEVQQSLILEAIALATAVETVDDLDRLLDGPLYQLLEFEVAICGIGVSLEKGCYGHKFHRRDFPLEYFDDLANKDGTVNSPLMKIWRETRKPVYFQSGRDDVTYPAEWVKIFNKHNLRNTVATAILDRLDVVSNYLIFARLKNEVGQRETQILEMLTPTLCSAVSRALRLVEPEDVFAGAVHNVFSRKQRNVLKWIYHGKTNWEISQILDMNEETVKYHVEQAMMKLDVKTRAQAVGRAIEIGLISPDKT